MSEANQPQATQMEIADNALVMPNRISLAAAVLFDSDQLRALALPFLWPVVSMSRDPLQAILDEAVRHGANERDLGLLREQFRRQAESNKLADESIDTQISDIPS